MKKAQMSFELMMVVAFVLMVMIPLIFFLYSKSNEASFRVSHSLASSYVKTLISSSEMVYFSGNGSFISLFVNVPRNIDSIEVNRVQNRNISIVIAHLGEDSVSYVANAPIEIKDAGKLTAEGSKTIRVENKNGLVVIS